MRHRKMLWTALLAAVFAAGSMAPAYAAITEAINEDFEGLAGDLVESDPNDPNSEVNRGSGVDGMLGWTQNPPTGWTIDNSDMLNNDGVTEWYGWTFVTKDFWVEADNQARDQFTRATNIVAVADPDEYDDINSGSRNFGFNSVLITPEIDIDGRSGIVIDFVSHYRPEGTQHAELRIQFLDASDNEVGETVLLDLDSTNMGDTARNRFYQFRVESGDFPSGATKAVYEFDMFDAGNNWYWGLDDILVRVHDGELTDSDDDGLTDIDETNTHGTDPNDPDTDDDGLSDGDEVLTYVTDPLDADTDDDGIEDGDEVNTYASDPNDTDTDGDSLSDGDEVTTYYTLPTDADSDHDFVNDDVEVNTDGTDPVNPYDYAGAPARSTYFFESFSEYLALGDATAAGWVHDASGNAPWAIVPPANDTPRPPMDDGRPSKGPFAISFAAGEDDMDTGQSSDFTTPAFDCSEASAVWLHADVSAQLNNNGTGVFFVDVNNGGGWETVFKRVAPHRDREAPADTHLPNNDNCDGFFGRLELDLSAHAAGESSVQVRFRHYEQHNDWWIAVDNVLVDDTPALSGGPATLFVEDFNDATLGQMSVVSLENNTGAETWSTVDKGNRYEEGVGLHGVDQQNVNRLMHPEDEEPDGSVHFAILDSDADPDPSEDEYLVTPSFDFTLYDEVYLHFDDEIVYASSAVEEVLVSLDDGATWEPTPIFSYARGALADNGEEPWYAERVFQVDAAVGEPRVKFAFHYQGGNNWWWAVDNIMVTGNESTADADGDGLLDHLEDRYGTDPNNPDSDGDGIEDGAEVWTYGTNPADADTDGDGVSDDTEITEETGPNNPYDYKGAKLGSIFFFEPFDYPSDLEAAEAGWVFTDTPEATEESTWTVSNPGGRNNPPMFDGRPSKGGFIASDSDAMGSNANPGDSGASHDAITPSFSTVTAEEYDEVWLHASVVAQLNNNGQAVFFVDVSNDGGANWTTFVERVAPARSGYATYEVTNDNADGFFGQLSVDITSVASQQSDVQVRLRHYEPNWDWFILVDNVMVNTVGPHEGYETLFEEDFSSGLGQMTVTSTAGNEGTDATWNTQDPGGLYAPGTVDERNVNRLMHPDPRTGSDGVTFAIIDPEAADDMATPPADMDEWLMTPAIDLTNYVQVHVHFSEEVILEYGPCRVVVSYDGGSTWTPILDYFAGAEWNGEEDPFYAERSLPVPAGSGEAIIAWHYGGQPSDDHYWAIDNIQVTGLDATADDDGDGLNNGDEIDNGSDPMNPDTDGDGVNDGDEVSDGTDPTDPDTDDDGLDDGAEITYGTDPNDADSDDDGYSDGQEVSAGTDPNDGGSFPGIPLAAWPVAIGLLAAGAVALRRKRR